MLPADDTSPSGTQYLPRVCGYINFVEELLVSFVTIIGLHPLCNNKKSIWAYENSFCLLPYFTIYFYLVRKPLETLWLQYTKFNIDNYFWVIISVNYWKHFIDEE